MNLDEVDILLGKWQSDIQAASANLVAFEASSAFQTVKTALPKLQGRTKAEIGPGIEGMEPIWPYFTLLNNVIKDAAELRKDMPQIFGRGDRILKIEQLLTGESIALQTKEVPLAERGLTGAGVRVEKTTPEFLFKQMQTRFQAGAKAASVYETACLELTEKLGKAFEELDKPTVKPNTILRNQLDSVKDLIDVDPLSGLERFNLATRKVKAPSARIIKPQEQPKETIVSKVIAPAPKVEPPKPSPMVAPTLTTIPSRLIPDGRVGHLVAENSLSTLERMILTDSHKETPKQQVSPTDPDLASVIKGKDKQVNKIDDLINKPRGSPSVSEPTTQPNNHKLEDLLSRPQRKPKGDK